jgi:hypothetical protein
MKSLVHTVVIAAALSAPVAVFAQSNQPVTRTQLREEMIELLKAGYNPVSAREIEYPLDLWAAQARVAAQKASMGGVNNGSSQDRSAAQ